MGVENVDNLKKMVSTQEVADIIGKGIRTVQDLAKSGILTCEKVKGKNQYNLYTVIREYCSYVAKREEKNIRLLKRKRRRRMRGSKLQRQKSLSWN
nr:MAG TPA: Protein of unknown function (DUF1441) [Caudoviricetes sp.]